MNGNFNGIRLRKITSRKTYTTAHGTVLESFRVAEFLPDLETALRLDAPVLLILSNATIEGNIVAFSAPFTSLYISFHLTLKDAKIFATELIVNALTFFGERICELLCEFDSEFA